MKIILVLIASLLALPSLAAENYTRFRCVSQTYSGKLVTISACIGNQVYGDYYYKLVPCGNSKYEYVTIRREIPVEDNVPEMIEIVRIPGRLFEVIWVEDGFFLNTNHKNVGYVNLELVAGQEEQLFQIDMPGMQHTFKAVGCTFKDH
jgi:hypothetical protein